jgi:hypothetical protein
VSLGARFVAAMRHLVSLAGPTPSLRAFAERNMRPKMRLAFLF